MIRRVNRRTWYGVPVLPSLSPSCADRLRRSMLRYLNSTDFLAPIDYCAIPSYLIAARSPP